jgi:hypothetical protein
VDERVWVVQLVEHAGTKVTKEDHHAGGKSSQGRREATQAGRPRSAGLPYKNAPPVLVFSRQATLPPLCVLEVLVQNCLRLSHPSQVCLLKQITPFNPLKVHTPK